MIKNFDYFVSFEDVLTVRHVPYDLRIYVNDVLRVKEFGLVDVSRQPLTRPIQNVSTRPQRIRIDIQTPCGAFNREFTFDPAFCQVR